MQCELGGDDTRDVKAMLLWYDVMAALHPSVPLTHLGRLRNPIRSFHHVTPLTLASASLDSDNEYFNHDSSPPLGGVAPVTSPALSVVWLGCGRHAAISPQADLQVCCPVATNTAKKKQKLLRWTVKAYAPDAFTQKLNGTGSRIDEHGNAGLCGPYGQQYLRFPRPLHRTSSSREPEILALIISATLKVTWVKFA